MHLWAIPTPSPRLHNYVCNCSFLAPVSVTARAAYLNRPPLPFSLLPFLFTEAFIFSSYKCHACLPKPEILGLLLLILSYHNLLPLENFNIFRTYLNLASFHSDHQMLINSGTSHCPSFIPVCSLPHLYHPPKTACFPDLKP